MRAWTAPPTLHIAGLRVKEQVYVRATHYARHRCAQNADHLAHNTPFSAFFAEVVCVLGAAPPQAATSQPQNGGNDAIQASDTPVTRRQRASHDAKPPLPTTKQPHEGPQGEAAVPEGGGRARPQHWWATEGPGCGTGGRRQGQGGPRDRPLRAAGSRVAISRAGRRPPAHTAAGPSSARNTRGTTSNTRKQERRHRRLNQ